MNNDVAEKGSNKPPDGRYREPKAQSKKTPQEPNTAITATATQDEGVGVLGDVLPRPAADNHSNGAWANLIFFCQHFVCYATRRIPPSDFANIGFGGLGTDVRFPPCYFVVCTMSIGTICCRAIPSQIYKAIISSAPISVAGFFSCWTWADKSSEHEVVDFSRVSFPIYAQANVKIAPRSPQLQQTTFTAFVAPDATIVANAIPIESRDWFVNYICARIAFSHLDLLVRLRLVREPSRATTRSALVLYTI